MEIASLGFANYRLLKRFSSAPLNSSHQSSTVHDNISNGPLTFVEEKHTKKSHKIDLICTVNCHIRPSHHHT